MKLDGIQRGSVSYPGKPDRPVTGIATDDRKPTRRGDPKARKGQRVADSRVVLMSQGR